MDRRELRAWLAERLTVERVPDGYIERAILDCEFAAQSHPHKRKPGVAGVDLRMRCRCEVSAGGKTFTGTAA